MKTSHAIASLLPLLGWVALRVATHGARWDHLAFALLAVALAASRRTARLYASLYPFALFAVVYDALAWSHAFAIGTRSVHVCDLRALDAAIVPLGGRTIHDLLQVHATLALDVIFATPYALFVLVEVAFAAWLAWRFELAAKRFAWAFLATNLLAFVTYKVFPAAPPWYFHAKGCVTDAATRPFEGPNLARVDAWLGVPYFGSFYRRSGNVFGAMPSMHVAYPSLIAIERASARARVGLAVAAVWALWMAVAAVYLDHHWIVDVVVGAIYAALGWAVARALVRPASRARA